MVATYGIGPCPAAAAKGDVFAGSASARVARQVADFVQQLRLKPYFLEVVAVFHQVPRRYVKKSARLHVATVAYESEASAAHAAVCLADQSFKPGLLAYAQIAARMSLAPR